MNELVFELPAVPPSVNTIWRRNPRGGMYLNKTARAFYELVALTLSGSRVPEFWERYDVEIIVYPRARRGDVDNYIKPVLDSLTKAGFWEDDALVDRVSCARGEVDKKGKTRLIIRESRKA